MMPCQDACHDHLRHSRQHWSSACSSFAGMLVDPHFCQVEVTNGHLGFLAYEARFYAPHKQAGSNTPLFYSYEVSRPCCSW